MGLQAGAAAWCRRPPRRDAATGASRDMADSSEMLKSPFRITRTRCGSARASARAVRIASRTLVMAVVPSSWLWTLKR
eukprot:7330277-Pyramimonas_sp.AAC.1